jgi:hypothetical protein
MRCDLPNVGQHVRPSPRRNRTRFQQLTKSVQRRARPATNRASRVRDKRTGRERSAFQWLPRRSPAIHATWAVFDGTSRRYVATRFRTCSSYERNGSARETISMKQNNENCTSRAILSLRFSQSPILARDSGSRATTAFTPATLPRWTPQTGHRSTPQNRPPRAWRPRPSVVIEAFPSDRRFFSPVQRRSWLCEPARADIPRHSVGRLPFASRTSVTASRYWRLLVWYQQEADLGARLPALATYLGHVGLASSQRYLQLTADMVGETTRRHDASDT